MDQSRSLGRIEGTLHSHGQRLDRIEMKAIRSTAKDILPYLYGIAVLIAALLGKIDAGTVFKLLGGH